MGGQVSWLLPAALIGLAVMAWLSWRAVRTDRLRASAMIWGGWLLVTGAVFSFMAGIIHPYYTVALVPAIGALTGIGAVELWRRRQHPGARLTLAAGFAATAVWAYLLLGRAPGWLPWLRTVVLLMTGAAYATARAIESGRTRWLVLTGGLLGFAFLTKMLQGFLVVPPFALAYLVAGPPRLSRRLWQLLAGAAALVAGAGWWVAIVELTPAADRPYIGGSTTNSVLQLALGYNGLGRLDGNETGSVGFGGGAGPRFGGSAGLTRLFATDMGGQVSWLLPAALIALAVMAWLSWRAARTDRLRAAALLWGGWLLLTGGVFSFMAGIIHPYYTVALALSLIHI